MQHTFRNVILVLLLLAACLTLIMPVEDKLRLGKDLAGGVSLVYIVELDEDDTTTTVDEIIGVLQARVNPDGLYEITMVRQGRDRILISMPLPNAEVQGLRDVYEEALDSFEAFELNIDAFERAMRFEGQARIEALEELASQSEAIGRIIEPVTSAALLASETRRAFDSAGDVTGAERDKLLDAAGEAEAALDEARQIVLGRAVTADRFRQALELSNQGTQIDNDATGEKEILPSSREIAIQNIRDRLDGIDGATEAIDRVIEANTAFADKRTGYDDPADLIRVLKGSGVLDFRIAVTPGSVPAADLSRLREELTSRGAEYVQSDRYIWQVLNKAEDWYDSTADIQAMNADPAGYFNSQRGLVAAERDGQIYILLHDEAGLRLTKAEGNGEWALDNAFTSSDEFGRPAIGFRMDPRGATLLGEMTGNNVQRPMAVLLDGRVYTVATINSRISSSGVITGTYSAEELGYIIKTLNAGSLSAKLGAEPVSQQTLAPGLGLDNLKMGLTASWIALLAVCVFMVFYYFTSGFVAMIALFSNALIIMGVMSFTGAAFTLPGIAGIVLTFGMAVDANVLIYERIREELLKGNDLRAAVRIAYQKVFSTIIDANVTNLIVCLVLAYTATVEVKGFAITLGIGIMATLFSSLVITKLVFSVLIDHVKITKMRQLPMVVPFIQKALEPNIDWIRLRPVFLIFSTCFVGLGISMIVIQGKDMLDTEFRGGTAVTLQLKEDGSGTGQQLTLTRSEVEERVLAIAERAEAGEGDPILADLLNAEIVAVNGLADGVTSSTFTVKSTIADDPDTDINEQQIFVDALVGAFTDVIDSQPAISFAGGDAQDLRSAPVRELLYDELGRNIDRPDVSNNVGPYVGGVAVVIDRIDPPVTKRSLKSRLEYMRNQPDYASALRRPHELIVLDGTDEAVTSAVLVALDRSASFFDDAEAWRADVAQSEWNLVRDALTTSTTLAGVQSFSAVIAESFRAQAVVAVTLSFLLIVLYIWVRFGSVRYSLAAVAALLHDVIAAIGLIALAEIAYEHLPWAAEIGLQPYKINLAMVAAILTIIGYSLNDTIVILDRIRENRGKLAYASRAVVNRSISQTISRTVITSGTTLVALLVLFNFGGDALSAFTYALICGVIVGTYSSIAVAAPLVFTSKIPPSRSYENSAGDSSTGLETNEYSSV